MIRPDIVVTWPRNTDYPLWRQYIRDNRARFDNIIIVWHETNQGFDYREFIKEAMFPDFVLFVQPPPLPAGEDWRNWSVNHGLYHSLHNPWIYFTEQDFFTNDSFWDSLELGEREGAEVMGVNVAGRLHPCCIFVKRSVLEQTHKDFSAMPEKGYDHFGRFQKDIEELNVPLGHFAEADWKHYNGLSHNFTLLSRGEEPNYEPRDFVNYLTKCMQVEAPLHTHFVSVVGQYLMKIEPEMGSALLQQK